jgi:hypothetical protein
MIRDWIGGAAPAERSGGNWTLRRVEVQRGIRPGLGSGHKAKGFVEGSQIQEAPMGLQVEASPGWEIYALGTELTSEVRVGDAQAASGAVVHSVGRS